MKILIVLEIILCLVIGTNYAMNLPQNIEEKLIKKLDENQFLSFNNTLIYEMPEGYEDRLNYNGVSEIAISSVDGNNRIMADFIDKNQFTPEEFITNQESFLIQSGIAELNDEYSTNENGRKVNKKVYEINQEMLYLNFYIATLELKENKDSYIGIMGSGVNYESEEAFDRFVSSITLTGESINKPRIFSSEDETVQITMPANWKRFEKNTNYSFYKQDKNGFLYFYTKSYNKNELDPIDSFNATKHSIENNFEEAKIYKPEWTEDLKDKTITSIVYEYNLDGQIVYSYFSIIDFKNTNIFAMSNSDIAINGTFDNVSNELEEITKSITIKK